MENTINITETSWLMLFRDTRSLWEKYMKNLELR
jgi:hypothetical protein